MDQRVAQFLAKLLPYEGIWTHFLVSTAAIHVDNQLVSLATKLWLRSEVDPPPELCQDVGGSFVMARFAMKAENFADYLSASIEGARVVLPANRSVSLLVPRYSAHDSEPSFSFFQIATRAQPADRLAPYNQQIELQTQCGDPHKIPDFQGRLEQIEREVRSQTSYSGLRAAFQQLGLNFGYPSANQAVFSAVASFPFGLSYAEKKVKCEIPKHTIGKCRLKLFFDSNDVQNDAIEAVESSCDVQWPIGSKSAHSYLYFNGAEVGSIAMNRYAGTQQWRVQVDSYFDHSGTLLKAGLEERKNTEMFEQSVVRLLVLLGMPCVWYGDKRFNDRSDLAAAFETEQRRIVLLGECVGQKPSTKFTPLLNRVRDLREQVDDDVFIIPVVFTASQVSSSDQAQARLDGIALVGRSELDRLRNLCGANYLPDRAINFLKSLMTTEDSGFPIRVPSGPFG